MQDSVAQMTYETVDHTGTDTSALGGTKGFIHLVLDNNINEPNDGKIEMMTRNDHERNEDGIRQQEN
jgi:hypothetical protein